MRTVLVVGGTGHFGRIIARRLSGEKGMQLVLAARDRIRVTKLAEKLGCEFVVFDVQSDDLDRALARLKPYITISTAGPFQPENYRLPCAALRASSHYLDLADNRGYIRGFPALDAAARERELTLVTGVSSVPALTSAVVEHYAPSFASLEEVRCGISSSEQMVGLATVRGVLAQCGKPFTRLEGGTWREVFGWDSVSHRRIADLGTRWFGDCDVPDLELLPARHASLRTVCFQAGTGLRLTHYGLWLIAKLVRLRVIADAGRYASFLRAVAVALEPMGSGNSAMFVQLDGRGHDGRHQRRTWELVARRNQGIEIPCIPAIVLTKQLLSGALSWRGARACLGLVSLKTYLEELAPLDVVVRGTNS